MMPSCPRTEAPALYRHRNPHIWSWCPCLGPLRLRAARAFRTAAIQGNFLALALCFLLTTLPFLFSTRLAAVSPPLVLLSLPANVRRTAVLAETGFFFMAFIAFMAAIAFIAFIAFAIATNREE